MGDTESLNRCRQKHQSQYSEGQQLRITFFQGTDATVGDSFAPLGPLVPLGESHGKETNKHKKRHTHGHCDCQTEPAQSINTYWLACIDEEFFYLSCRNTHSIDFTNYLSCRLFIGQLFKVQFPLHLTIMLNGITYLI